jgi:hypothetical protein
MSLYSWYRLYTERKKHYFDMRFSYNMIVFKAWQDSNDAF